MAARTIFHEIICLFDQLARLTTVQDVAVVNVNVEEDSIQDLHFATSG